MISIELKNILRVAIAAFLVAAAGESVCAQVQIVSVSIDSETSASQSDVPVTFGQVFKRGEVFDPALLGAQLADGTGVPLQVDVKATHADGSLRHAALTIVMPEVNGNSETEIHVVAPGVAASGASVALSDLLATSFDTTLSVDIGGIVYSASARDLLQTNVPIQWLDGPLVSEWLVAGPLATSGGSSHDHLTARFHVRAYENLESVRVSVTLENNWAFEDSPQNYLYDANVSVEGVGTVLAQSDVTHYRQSRWRRTFWWGQQPEIHVAHDTTYMAETGAIPTYDSRLEVPGSVLDGMVSEWSGNVSQLLATGLIYNYMPSGGARRDIAPLPRWTVRYLLTQDPRAKISMLGTAEQAGSFDVHFRDKNTDLPVSLDTYPNITILGSEVTFPQCGGDCSTPNVPDIAHQPSMPYVPYLVTADYFHLEELQFWTNWNLFYWGDHGGSQGLMVFTQIRAQAWGLRTLGHAAYITPDGHPLKAYFLSKLSSNLTWYKQNIVNNPPTPLGYLMSPPDIGVDDIIATWMDDFFTWSVGHLANLGFDEAIEVFDYKANFPVGRMTNSDSCWILAPTYYTRSRNDTTGQPFTNWADYQVGVVRSWDHPTLGPSFSEDFVPPNMSSEQEDALIAADCNSSEMASILGLQRGEMIGGSWSHEAYTAQMQPAVAISAERDYPNGDDAWDLFDSRTVKPDSGVYNYNVNPEWAVVPGNLSLGNTGSGQSRPTVSLSANPMAVVIGESSTLSWSSSAADTCSASDSWSGSRATAGTETVGPLNSDSVFSLSCSNQQGSTSTSITVAVVAAAGAPVVSLTASSDSVPANSNVTLTWSSQNTTGCTASGDWSGVKQTAGTESVGPLTSSSSYTLTCDGVGASDAATVNVLVTAAPGNGNDNESGAGALGWTSLLALLTVYRIRTRKTAQARVVG